MRNTMLIAVAIMLIFSSEIYACEPCGNSLDFNETVRRSDLVIIGEKFSDGPWTGLRDSQAGPDWIEVKVHDVLKGESNEDAITINSWNGMCSYGILIGDGKHIIFLKRRMMGLRIISTML